MQLFQSITKAVQRGLSDESLEASRRDALQFAAETVGSPKAPEGFALRGADISEFRAVDVAFVLDTIGKGKFISVPASVLEKFNRAGLVDVFARETVQQALELRAAKDPIMNSTAQNLVGAFDNLCARLNSPTHRLKASPGTLAQESLELLKLEPIVNAYIKAVELRRNQILQQTQQLADAADTGELFASLTPHGKEKLMKLSGELPSLGTMTFGKFEQGFGANPS